MGYGPSQVDPSHNHRIYELRIPLASLGAAPRQAIFFASPIDPAAPKKCSSCAGMPYDGDTGNDNARPVGLVVDDRGTWGVLDLADLTATVPTIGPAGATLLGLLLAAAGVILVARRTV
jgi:hypothetical protein